MAFDGRDFLGVSLTFLLATGALAEPSPEAAIASAIRVATSWPPDMRDLPVPMGKVAVMAEIEQARSEVMKTIGLQGRWHGSAGVKMPPDSPEFYMMICERVGADFLARARAVREGDPGLAEIEPLLGQKDRDMLTEVIPARAEAAMICRHFFVVDGADAGTVLKAVEQAAGKRFAASHAEERPDHAQGLVAEGWSGDPANGVARIRVVAKAGPDRSQVVNMIVTSYSWRLPDGS